MVTGPAARTALGSRLSRDAGAWMAAAAAIAMFVLTLFNAKVLGDPDSYWHLAAGGWILDHRAVPHTDVFSHTYAGRPWTPHEWLSEVLMALAYRAAGWSGLLVLFGLALAGAAGLMAARLARYLSGIGLVLALVLAFGVIAPGLLTRPHVLVLPVMVLWVLELLSARDAGRGPRLFVPALMALWANLHGSYVLGFVLMAPFALEALGEARDARWRAIRDWGGVGLLCVAGAALTPHGLQGLLFPFKVAGMETLNQITEWRPADFSQIKPFEIAVLATLFVCLSRGVKIPPLRLLLLLVLLHLSLQHVRHQTVLALVGPLLLAAPIAAALGRTPGAPRRSLAPLAVFALAAFALAGVRFATPAVRGDDAVTPHTALSHVPPALRARAVFNSYDFGGYLISQGVRPFIDGRADMYGDAFVRRHTAATEGGAALDAALSRYRIDWTILSPEEPAVRDLDAKPGWRRIWSDGQAVVHVRADALAAVR